MKKLSTRFVFLFALTAASLCSYVFLNTVETTTNDPVISNTSVEEDLNSEDEATITLPDVTLMKRAFELGKRFVRNY